MRRWCVAAAARLENAVKALEAGAPLSACHVILLSNLYLLGCYCYYEKDHSVMSDALFDGVCKNLAERYAELMGSGAWFLELFDDDALAAGSGYHLKGKCPLAIMQIADIFLQRAGVKA